MPSPYPEPDWRTYSPSVAIACTAIRGRLAVIHACYMRTYIKSLTLNATWFITTCAVGELAVDSLSNLIPTPPGILLVHGGHTLASSLSHLVVVPPHNATR